MRIQWANACKTIISIIHIIYDNIVEKGPESMTNEEKLNRNFLS